MKTMIQFEKSLEIVLDSARRQDPENEFKVIEVIPAGAVPKKSVGPNNCAKIMTGSMVPSGTNRVVMVEFTESVAENTIRFVGKTTSDDICKKAEDIKAGRSFARVLC